MGAIRATGGDIGADKSFWTLIDFAFPNKKEPIYRSIADTPATLHMPDGDNHINLRRIEPNEAIETLGVLLAADGTEQHQIDALKNKVQQWCNKLGHRALPTEVIMTALNTTIAQTLAYPMAVTTLNLKQCQDITSRLRQTVLPLLGFNRNMPITIVEADIPSGGLGFPNLFSEQLAQRNAMMVEHGTANTVTGKLIRTSLKIMKLELGNGSPSIRYGRQRLVVSCNGLLDKTILD